MHEWALAESVLKTLGSYLENHPGKRVTKIELACGELQNIDLSVFQAGLAELASPGLNFDPSVFILHSEQARFECRNCQYLFDLSAFPELTEGDREAIHFLPEAAHTCINCPQCGSTDYKVVQGRGVLIQSIELEDLP